MCRINEILIVFWMKMQEKSAKKGTFYLSEWHELRGNKNKLRVVKQ